MVVIDLVFGCFDALPYFDEKFIHIRFKKLAYFFIQRISHFILFYINEN